MKEEKLLEMIQKSAENLDVPQGLNPESVEMLLKEKAGASVTPSPRKKAHYLYRWGSAAAAFLILSTGIWGILANSSNASTSPENTILTMTADGEDALAVPSDHKGSEDANAPAPVEKYSDLFYAMKEQKDVMVYERGLFTDAQAEESAVDSASSIAQSDAPAAGKFVEHSQTNLRTEGVDEGDIVKMDDTCLYIASPNEGLRIVDAKTTKLIATLTLPDYSQTIQEFYLEGELLQIIATGTSSQLTGKGDTPDHAYSLDVEERTTVYSYDISRPTDAQLLGEVSQSGSYNTSRKNGDYLYLFTSYYPQLPDTPQQRESYVPKSGDTLIPRGKIFIPSNCTSREYLVVSSLNKEKPDSFTDTASILSGTELFYASSDHIYIASHGFGSSQETMELMSFSYGEGAIAPQAGGTIPGRLNNSFSLDESKGYLRLVTTLWDSKTQRQTNGLYVLDQNLKTVGRITDLAPGETIQSARFMGDAGYFVTFRQTDPLFSVDLSDPRNPRILGELKITGFSEYLHLYEENLLLGIGWEADPDTGTTTGLKLSMFDISDPSNVTQKHKLVIQDAFHSPAMDNYKAVLIDPEKNLFGFAYQVHLDENYSKLSSVYSLFSYDSKKGFSSDFTYSLDNKSLYNEYYSPLERVRGLYWNDIFYLSTPEGLSAFRMDKGFAQSQKLTW